MDKKWQEILNSTKEDGIITEEQRHILEIEFIEKNENNMPNIIAKLLRNLGIPMHIYGYRYLVEAVQECLNDPYLCYSITKMLYPNIANKFDVSAYKVERCMRTAIEIGWLRGNLELKEEVFGYTVNPEKGKPSNAEFITGVVEYINLERL